MAKYMSGDVVVLPYPFTDFSSHKVRPALVLASLSRGDVILCQITSQAGAHHETVAIRQNDFNTPGKLPLDSYALPHRVVTANESCVLRCAGQLRPSKLNEVRDRVCAKIRGEP